MSTLTFDHVRLYSPDRETTAAFYEMVFDAESVRSAPGGQPCIAFLREPLKRTPA